MKIKLLGFEEGSISYLIDTALETEDFNQFEIILNTEKKPDIPRIVIDKRMVSMTTSGQYREPKQGGGPVHFGVLHAHIKYILYQYFLHYFNIGKNRYHSFIHPLAYISKSCRYDKGFYLGQMSAVSSFNNFGFGVTIKKSCSIGHHSEFGDFVTINPGSVVAGYTLIGEGTEIGSGSTVLNNITIGKNCLIGAGSVVAKNIPDGVIAYGNPCKVIRKNERWQNVDKRLSEMMKRNEN